MSLSGGAEDEELSESEFTGISISAFFFPPVISSNIIAKKKTQPLCKQYLIKDSYRANISRKQSECMCKGLCVNTNLVRGV